MHDQLRLTQSNFNDIVTETLTDTSPQVKPTVHHSTKTCTILTCPASDKIRSSPPFQVLQTTLLQKCDALYHQQFPRNDNFLTERDMLTEHQAWRISKNSDVLGKSASLREILGSEALDGQFDCILQTIKDWEQSDIFKLTGRQRAALSKARVQKAWAKDEKKKTGPPKMRASLHPTSNDWPAIRYLRYPLNQSVD
ncbi:hypothetical protein DFH28DRAFT_919516 [Melampsora americana]|nr:hypothetical protein DFH28DRAFT_919516 [Melampsora americana]